MLIFSPGMQSVGEQPYQEAFSPPSGGSPVDVLPGVGQLTLTGFAPIVSTSVDVLPGVGQLAVTGYAPTIETPVTVTPGVGVLSLTGLAPTVSTPVTVLPGVGTLTVAGFAPTIYLGTVIKPARSPTQILFLDVNGTPLVPNALPLKTGETGPRLLKLAGADGTAEDLSAATGIKATISRWNGTALVNGRPVTIVDAVNGIVSFAQQAGDFPYAGTFQLEVQITRGDGTIGQFPELGYAVVEVTRSLTS